MSHKWTFIIIKDDQFRSINMKAMNPRRFDSKNPYFSDNFLRPAIPKCFLHVEAGRITEVEGS